MVQPAGKADSRGKAVVKVFESSEDSRTQYRTRVVSKPLTPHSPYVLTKTPIVFKEPMKMSPVLAAVLNIPPPFHKPFLIPPRSNSKLDLVEANKAAARELGSKKPAAYLSPRYHPYNPNPIQLQDKFKEKTTTNNNPKASGFMRQLLRNHPRHHQLAAPDEKEGYTETNTAMDMLGEWRPVTVRCYGEDGCRLGTRTSSGKNLSRNVSRKYAVDVVREPDDPLPDIELGLRPPGRLDLRLKLGF